MSALFVALCLSAAPEVGPVRPLVQLDLGTSSRPATPNEETFAGVAGLRAGANFDLKKGDAAVRLGLEFRGSTAGPLMTTVPLEAGGFVQFDVWRPVQLDTGVGLSLFLGADLLARHLGNRPRPWSTLYLFNLGLRVGGICLTLVGGFEDNPGRLVAGVLEMRLGFELFEFARLLKLTTGAPKNAVW